MKIPKKNIYFFVFIIITLYLIFSLSQPIDVCANKDDIIEIKTLQLEQGWGFDIIVNNKKYIHQTHIPAINKKKAFKTKKDAKKIAELMKIKMCKNILPPSVSIQEIDSLLITN